MSKQKTMTLEEFEGRYRKHRKGFPSMFAPLFDELNELEPVAVTVGNEDLKMRRSALAFAATTRYGKRRVRTLINNGVLYACLMPSNAGNGS